MGADTCCSFRHAIMTNGSCIRSQPGFAYVAHPRPEILSMPLLNNLWTSSGKVPLTLHTHQDICRCLPINRSSKLG
jgi:hypothetical protein